MGMLYLLFTDFSPTCFGRYCGHLQVGVILTRLKIIIIFNRYGVTATQLTTFVPLYSCNNSITLKMAAIADETCWCEDIVNKIGHKP